MSQVITYTLDIRKDIDRLCAENYDQMFILTDDTTEQLCRPLLGHINGLEKSIVIPAGDDNKTLETVSKVWTELQQRKASRHSLLINLGGGMVTDLGGFAASTFKRGIDFINIPTTLLAMVDAAVGGKTGINFNDFKNEIGVFRDAREVIIDTSFLRSLDSQNLRSGYAEMLKHSLLKDTAMWASHVTFDLCKPNFVQLQEMVRQSIEVKRAVVAEDPTEKGIRKALNLGHTFGHALESLAMLQQRTGLHGYFVAWGLICELYLSCSQGFPIDKMRQTVRYIRENYGNFPFSCNDYEHLYQLMLHDKKNVGNVINFTLLRDVGDILIDQHATKEEVFEAFDFLREG